MMAGYFHPYFPSPIFRKLFYTDFLNQMEKFQRIVWSSPVFGVGLFLFVSWIWTQIYLPLFEKLRFFPNSLLFGGGRILEQM